MTKRPPVHALGFPWTVQWSSEYPSIPSLAFAPERLWQSINPGWSFGNVYINEKNSSAPEVEYAIAQEHSYGRQIGHIQEALVALLDLLDKDAKPTLQTALTASQPIRQFQLAAAAVAATKNQALQANQERMLKELQYLKANAPAEWEKLVKEHLR